MGSRLERGVLSPRLMVGLLMWLAVAVGYAASLVPLARGAQPRDRATRPAGVATFVVSPRRVGVAQPRARHPTRRTGHYTRPQRLRFRHSVVELMPSRDAASSSVGDSESTRWTWSRSTSSSDPCIAANDGAGKPVDGAST